VSGVFDDELATVASDVGVLDMAQDQRFAGLVRLPGQHDIHRQDAAVQLLHQTDGLVLVELQRVQKAGHLGEDGLEGRERITLLDVLTRAPLLLVIGLAVAAIAPAVPVTTPISAVTTVTSISVPTSLTHGRILSFTWR
jgi:hypothetical protein